MQKERRGGCGEVGCQLSRLRWGGGQFWKTGNIGAVCVVWARTVERVVVVRVESWTRAQVRKMPITATMRRHDFLRWVCKFFVETSGEAT